MSVVVEIDVIVIMGELEICNGPAVNVIDVGIVTLHSVSSMSYM